MKAMNEFEKLLVIAGLILAACAAMDLPLEPPHAAVSGSGGVYAGYSVVKSIDLALQDSAIAADGGAGDPLPAIGVETAIGRRPAPTLQVSTLQEP